MQWTTGAEQFLSALSSSDPTPGGGAAAAMTGAMGCALVMMAIGTTLKRKNTPASVRPVLEQSLPKLGALHTQLKKYMQQDALAYEGYLTACKLPKDNPSRTQAVQDALWYAASVPADTATVCQEVLKETARTQDLIDKIIVSDVNCARHLLHGALQCCAENIRINATYITQQARKEKLQKILENLAGTR
ncbi:MAG: cyclodeaminase/cyclohydrolase family protein [Elusimicrobiaceae bacterium]|nr:cyclodeaminase/cyclohydrolase family protein [Elusimicrobiaceae bacterium]